LESSLICLPNPAVIEETDIPGDARLFYETNFGSDATTWPITLLEGELTSYDGTSVVATDGTAVVSLYQISGFQNYDMDEEGLGGTFDCMGGFDHVFIEEQFIGGYLKGNWTPDGGYLLINNEGGGQGRLILNNPPP
jgi:hypothetical protein